MAPPGPGDIVTRRSTEARPTFKTRLARLIPSTRLWISCSTRDGVRDSTVPSVVDPRVGAPGHANPPSGAGTLLTHGGARQADVRSGVPSTATIRADHDPSKLSEQRRCGREHPIAGILPTTTPLLPSSCRSSAAARRLRRALRWPPERRCQRPKSGRAAVVQTKELDR